MAAPPEYKTVPPPMAGSQGSSAAEFPIPPAKRPRLSPQPSTAPYPQAQGNYAQHVSPYSNPSPAQSAPSTPSLYNNQNGASASPRFNHSPLPASPHFQNVQPSYTTPYSNGSTPAPTSALSTSMPYGIHNNNFFRQNQNYGAQNSQSPPGQNQFASHSNSFSDNTQNQSNTMAGNMGPPMKPAEKKGDEDQMDVLTGTGVDLREEEAYSQNQFTFSQNATSSQSTAFSSQNLIAGPEGSFYGSGRMSQQAEPVDGRSQEEWMKQVAEDAWHQAARNLAQSRQEELGDPFVLPKFMMHRLDKIARKEGVRINTRDGWMGRLGVPGQDYELPTQVQTIVGPQNGAILATRGQILPSDNLVVDQLILLSLATKHRTRQLLEDVVKIAKGRQVGSSGFVPSEWAESAVPANGADGTIASTDPEAPRAGWESAVSPRTVPNPSLRPGSVSANRLPTPVSDGGTKTPVPSKTFTNDLAKALRDAAEIERQHEEERLRKRLARQNGDGSIAPGTPGSVVANAGAIAMKAPSKKEIEKKTKEKRKEDAASNVSANATSNMFLGNMGKKGKKKTYSWMTSGSAAPSPGGTPVRTFSGGAAAAQDPQPISLTQPQVASTRLGTWRDDKSSGDKIQLRDWVAVLEQDGCAEKELQRAMLWLDDNIRPGKKVVRTTPDNH